MNLEFWSLFIYCKSSVNVIFRTVMQQLLRFQLIYSVAWSFSDSSISCFFLSNSTLSSASLIHHRFCPCHFPITITPCCGEWLLSREQNANGSRSSCVCTLHSALSDVLVSYELIRLNLPAPGWLNRCLVNNHTAVTVQLTCDTQRVSRLSLA